MKMGKKMMQVKCNAEAHENHSYAYVLLHARLFSCCFSRSGRLKSHLHSQIVKAHSEFSFCSIPRWVFWFQFSAILNEANVVAWNEKSFDASDIDNQTCPHTHTYTLTYDVDVVDALSQYMFIVQHTPPNSYGPTFHGKLHSSPHSGGANMTIIQSGY